MKQFGGLLDKFQLTEIELLVMVWTQDQQVSQNAWTA
jgi:hypothetical protein